MELKIIVPLVPLFDDGELVFLGMVNDLLEFDNSLELDMPYVGKTKLRISYLEKYATIFERYNPYGASESLVFSLIIPDNYEDIHVSYIKMGEESELSSTEKMDYFKSIVIEDFKLKIYHLIILSQIAHPGSIRLRTGIFYLIIPCVISLFQPTIFIEMLTLKLKRSNGQHIKLFHLFRFGNGFIRTTSLMKDIVKQKQNEL